MRWTYDDLAREVDALAAGLLSLGLEPGERIGVGGVGPRYNRPNLQQPKKVYGSLGRRTG